MKLGIDISNHEPGNYDYAALAKRGIIFCAIKATQGNYKKNACYERQLNGALPYMLTGGYNYLDADLRIAGQIKDQYDYFMNYAFHFPFKPQFIVLDIEKETEFVYQKPTKKKQSGTMVSQTMNADVLYNRIADMLGYFKRSGYPYIVYTRISWIKEFCPRLMKLLENEPTWLAQYPDTIVRHNLPEAEDAAWLKGIEARAATVDKGTLKHVLIWQFSDHYKCAGMEDDTDINMILDEHGFDEWIGGIAEQETVQLEVLTLESLGIRVKRLEELIDVA